MGNKFHKHEPFMYQDGKPVEWELLAKTPNDGKDKPKPLTVHVCRTCGIVYDPTRKMF